MYYIISTILLLVIVVLLMIFYNEDSFKNNKHVKKITGAFDNTKKQFIKLIANIKSKNNCTCALFKY